MKIAEGCNRTCAFCTIPEFRGKQRSRTEDDVVREAEQLVAQGIVELNLISQDTISYGRDSSPTSEQKEALARLVARVADVKGIRWVRLFYLYPETIDEALVDLLANHPRVVPYVDMPLQHAADAMLKRMRRGHGKDRQKRVVERLRKSDPGPHLPHGVHRRAPRARPTKSSTSCASSSSGRGSSTSACFATRTRSLREPTRWTTR